jgi:2-iminobutanoate/2-iminopropanoate deaminase
MSQLSTIATDAAPAAVGPYAQAVSAGGFLYISGQIPLAPESGVLVAPDIASQCDQVLRNLSAILDAAQCGVDRLVKVTIYLRDLNNFGLVNERYAAWLGAARPARATVEVSALPKGALIEIDAVALLP